MSNIDILQCILKIYPDWNGIVKYEKDQIEIIPDVSEKRQLPPLNEIEKIWEEIKEEISKEKRRFEYINNSDKIFIEYLVLKELNHPDAEIKKNKWLEKREEISKKNNN